MMNLNVTSIDKVTIERWGTGDIHGTTFRFQGRETLTLYVTGNAPLRIVIDPAATGVTNPTVPAEPDAAEPMHHEDQHGAERAIRLAIDLLEKLEPVAFETRGDWHIVSTKCGRKVSVQIDADADLRGEDCYVDTSKATRIVLGCEP